MTRSAKQHIFFVDDEAAICKSVSRTLRPLGMKVSCFTNAADCLEELQEQNCDLLITDVKMPGIDGIELVRRAKHITPWLPILVVTGYGDIPMAIKATKAGAASFIEKPLERNSFLATVESALKQNRVNDIPLGKVLSKTEKRILRLLLDGKNNKEIAGTLHRSVRTIEDHRSHIMHKLDANNLVELVKQIGSAGLRNL